ncbi:tigger transposable element-derived protein 4-like [Leptopilina heterotoma]|uniref:tigger transposable element-derived protein 4-like n=1 Tax=Leptopilina heterotoma TaxID=63436 RepID=UPI001CA9ECB3|nr:tigger transposable element-derived protein 4-like [Leptopilina heterotoma]
MVAANMSGTIKRKLLVIGKSKKPRCFKGCKSLLVDYTNNRRAWMRSPVFEKWIRDWDYELVKKNKKILLLVDNCPSHPQIKDLKSISLVFLTANTTAILQPMDQGVIRALKANFRKNLLINTIDHLHADKDLSSVNITVLDAILMVYDAWNKISQETVSNCFRHAGFIDSFSRDVACSQINVEDDVPVALWVKTLNLQLQVSDEM